VYEYWQSAGIAREKILNFLQIPNRVREARGAPELAAGDGRIEFRDVSVGTLVRSVTATARPGERIAIVGPNGAGKSTLLYLVPRLLDPDSGRVLVDGQDVRTVSLSSLRAHIGMVTPDAPLLRGSVGRNLRYRMRDVSQAQFEAACRMSGVDKLLGELPAGLDTRVGDGGRSLSAGQRQRIALARALMGMPRILLLDEADTNLDPLTRRVIGSILAEYSGTIVLVTHSPQHLGTVDTVWYMDSGRLLESGKPGALLSQSGPTQRLFQPASAGTRPAGCAQDAAHA